MPLRNPFRRAGAEVEVQNENQPFQRMGSDRSFQKTPVVGSKPIEIQEPIEFKLSEINDSGIFLPPSPTEKKSFWQTPSRTSTSSNHRSLLGENEPFNISRESFDSYRRSFDISARSPIPDAHTPRQSLDSRRSTYQSRASFDRRIERPAPTAEEQFEDVGLNDEVKPPSQSQQQQKKRGFLSRFGNDANPSSPTDDKANASENSRPGSSHLGFHFSGRKRGQSGKGEELRSMGKVEQGITA